MDDFDKLPSTLRFYSGGDSSIRGYGYRAIGPLGTDNKVAGGKHLIEASVTYEWPFKQDYSWAAFVDTGDAFDERARLHTGIGVGLRWRSPVGPIRVDLARALDDPGQGNVRLHLSIGPDL